MATVTDTQQTPRTVVRKASTSTAVRIVQYSLIRLVTLFATIVVGIYLTITIANMGRYVDDIMRGEIRERITMQVVMSPANKNLDPDVRNKLVLDEIAQEEKRIGLDQPMAIRTFRYLSNALVLDLGRAMNMTSDTGSRTVRLIILERLPATLLLMGTSNLFLFFILIFAAVLKVLPFGGMVSAPPPDNRIEYGLSVLKHLILPGSALVISAFFYTIYNWRTFFLIYSSEDYVDMAKAKGLTSRDIERSYILRPTLPTIITSFALMLIGLWTGAIITETVFLWPGLGRTLFRAIGLYDIPVIVGSTIIYAYLLAFTVFLLDFIYALVDPRVKIGGST